MLGKAAPGSRMILTVSRDVLVPLGTEDKAMHIESDIFLKSSSG